MYDFIVAINLRNLKSCNSYGGWNIDSINFLDTHAGGWSLGGLSAEKSIFSGN